MEEECSTDCFLTFAFQSFCTQQKRELTGGQVGLDEGGDPWAALLGAAVVPPLASAIANEWEPRDPEPVLAWFEAWEPLLPLSTRLTVLEHVILPKVSEFMNLTAHPLVKSLHVACKEVEAQHNACPRPLTSSCVAAALASGIPAVAPMLLIPPSTMIIETI